jgi:hypothetical protein
MARMLLRRRWKELFVRQPFTQNTAKTSKKGDYGYNSHIRSADNPWVRDEGGRELGTLALELACTESE